jgi:hypothetical protein
MARMYLHLNTYLYLGFTIYIAQHNSSTGVSAISCSFCYQVMHTLT